jgi:two-component system alkaline phosphatase synthesis response regulator PhoP
MKKLFGVDMSAKTILVVDDEIEIVNMLSLNLEMHGYKVLSAYNGEDALKIASSSEIDLILLDVMMPGISGIEVCKRLKGDILTRAIPVIMVSAKDQISDKIEGLSSGAEDYLTKPFNLQELLLRIKSNIKQVEVVSQVTSTYIVGNLVLDTTTFQAKIADEKLDLTLTEFRILQLLMSKKELVNKEELVQYIFEKSVGESGRVLDVHIRNLRKKIASSRINCTCSIETIRGIGYVCKEIA